MTVDVSLKDLNEAQRSAVQETSRPVLVLAGPGTGKTKMLVAKFAHLVIEKGIHPDRILITTFTTKATEELQGRIGAALQEAKHYSKVEVQNFHSLCLRILQEFGSEIGLTRDPPVLDGVALRRFLHDNRMQFKWEHVPFVRYVDGPLENLQRFTSRALSEGLTPEQALERARAAVAHADAADKGKLLPFLDYAANYAVVLQLLESKGVLTYDLMLYEAVRLLESKPHVAKEVRGRFDYVLVDEVQDNNGLQASIIELLVGDRGCVTVVGDEDQGIYKFRGAQRGVLQRFEERFKPVRINLWENYRSTSHIVDAAKAVIALNSDRYGDKKLEARGPNAALPVLVDVMALPDEDQEAILLAREIASHVEAGVRPKDIGVLYRSLNHVSRLTEELEARGVAYEIANTGRLLRVREVRDLWAWMAVLNDPYTDNPAFERVLSSREVGIPFLDLALVQRRYKKFREDKAKAEGKERDDVRINLVEMLGDLDGPYIHDEARDRLRWARRAIEALDERCRNLGALETAYQILGWLRPQGRFPPDDPHSKQMWLNIGHFLSVVKTYEESYPDAAGLRGFLSYLDYLDRQGAEFQDTEPDETQDSVKILTAHGAKGLEFDIVYMGGVCKDRFPTKGAKDWMHPILDPEGKRDQGLEQLEEERRVFFVAMTRARKRLTLTHPVSINGKERARSVFLDELCNRAPQHTQLTGITDPIPPAESAATVAEDLLMAEIHGAATVTREVDADELVERFTRVATAVFKRWQGEVKPQQFEAAKAKLAGLGITVPPPAKEPDFAQEGKVILSASALKTYADCPRKFQFQYVYRIPQRISPNAVAGSNVHRALEVFHRNHKADWATKSLDDLMKVYDEVAAQGRYANPEEAAEFRKRDVKILAAYLESEKQHKASCGGTPTHFEAFFEAKFPDLDAEFFGYVDRIDEHGDGSVEIIDYKTGSRDTPNKIVAEDYQMPLYVLAMESKGRKVKSVTMYWMREAGDGSGPVKRDVISRVDVGKAKGEFTTETLAAFREKLGRTVEDIRAGRYPENVTDFGCRYCDYRLLCPAWGS